ncbi:MAG: NERD domain-containing protein [Clostridia bacterium]|nr:NERD domain-containing protein [Clostridia bacterium]
MGLFTKKIGPLFIKEDSDATLFVERMSGVLTAATGELKDEIEKQIKLATYGEVGEKNIAFELKNSGMDMFILHDIYLETGDLSAQIDYIIITRKHVYVVECKNLIGNIEIDSTGKFIRSYELGGRRIKEGIYSPITQNERHLAVLKEVRKKNFNNVIMQALFSRNFEELYKSMVVLANPKTYLNDRYAKKEVKQQVIRADQLISKIREVDSEAQYSFKEDEMRSLAEFFLQESKPNKSDYARKYIELMEAQREAEENAPKEVTSKEKAEQNISCPKCGSKMVLRTAKKGPNAGSQFYGCSNYPYCRFVLNIKN